LSFDAAWEEALWSVARQTLGATAVAEAALCEAVVRVSTRYTSERWRLGRARDTASERAARLLFFSVADALKVQVPLAEAGLVPRRWPLRVLDVGAGVGATSVGLLMALVAGGQAGEVSVDLVDTDGDALAVADAALSAVASLAAPVAVQHRVTRADAKELPSASGAGYDLILAATVLNEIPAEARVQAARRWLDCLGPDGALILIEPALRETARDLERVRDQLVSQGARVLAPCTHAGPCPMLASERDWCHEDRAWDPPPRFAHLRQRVGLRREGLKLSYLVLAPLGAGAGGLAANADARRVVSAPLLSKGKRELWLCGEGRLERARLLDRQRSDENRAVGKAERGDLLGNDALTAPGVELLGPVREG
jgi:ribosomal protein RSM22 (predicted rRNA methylase)